MRARILAAAALVLAVTGLARGEDRVLDRAEVDRRVVSVVYQTAVMGTEMFNKGNHEGCFRLYQGTLLGVQPMLDHRPKLAASVKEKLDKAKGMKAPEGAFELRAALDEVQNEIAPGAKTDVKVDPKAEPKKTTLWDRLGGAPGVTKVVDDLFNAAIEDKDVNLLRDGKVKLDAKGVANFKLRLVEMISETTGGPLMYKGKDMKTAHAGMKITDKEFDAFAKLFVDALKKNKVAQADIDDLMKIIGATKQHIVEGKGN